MAQDQWYENPLLQMGLGILGANRPGATAASAIGGGALAGLRNFQEQQRQTELMRMRQQAMQQERDAQLQRAQWMQSQGFDPATPDFVVQQAIKSQYATQQPPEFGTSIQYARDRRTGQPLPFQASKTGGLFLRKPDGSTVAFDASKHELIKPFTMQDLGGYLAPFQPMTGLLGGSPSGPTQAFPPHPSGPYVEPGMEVAPDSKFIPTPDGGLTLNPAYRPPTYQKTLPPAQQPAVKGAQAEMQARAKREVEKEAEQEQAVKELEVAKEDMSTTLGYIDELRTHPGLESATGLSAMLPTIPGTSRVDFEGRLDQIAGTAFLQAYQGLRGGGHITEIEGKKAEQAIQRMQTPGLSKSAFLTALKDYENIVKKGYRKMQIKAKKDVSAGEPAGFMIRSIKRVN